MARVKRGTKRRARRKKYLKRTKGFFLTKSKLYQSAQEVANRADQLPGRPAHGPAAEEMQVHVIDRLSCLRSLVHDKAVAIAVER